MATTTRPRGSSDVRRRTRNPHVPPGLDDDPKAAREEHVRQLTREERLYGEIYDQGKRDARTEQRAQRRSRRSSSARRTVTRATKRRARKVGRAALAPTSSPTSGAQILGSMLALVALFLVLQNAATFAKFISAINTALAWLRSPTTSIPAK